MQENKSPLTISQALKLYTGTGLGGTVLGLAAYEVLFYIGAFVSMTLMIMLGEGISYPEAVRNIAETPAGDCVMVFTPGIINCIVLLSQYTKDKHGGKLFRTVKGGFGTFVRYRTGVYNSELLSMLLFGTAALLLDIAGIAKIHGGLSAVIALVVSNIAAAGIVTFMLPAKNELVLGAGSVITMFAITGSCTILLPMLSDNLIPHLVTGIAGAVLVAVSSNVYFAHYRKNRWDS
ncbi:MAG: hypothetical protein IJ784_02780 [Ruminiclostridium sp.]|nr:hypothetical protein [Ruminiclostridium sp.]